ncbi:MAG TPA: nucleotide exchange factor GrpE, partial [Gammaproteobacteria bacterium]|nr:nucleotide exchange factor GrpE [Gammaproteobacteria bacterium]
MSDNDNGETQQDEQSPENAQVETEASEQPSDMPEVDGLEAELAKVKDQLLRTIAESENIRRRASRDVEHAHKFAVEKLLN